ncbi:hypothetical protein BC831DRAFT_471167 [Entophlyctis helioformis]|nr:hypothetical protein BC831DRAFT_471167 [Entophlyctis helioformis]
MGCSPAGTPAGAPAGASLCQPVVLTLCSLVVGQSLCLRLRLGPSRRQMVLQMGLQVVLVAVLQQVLQQAVVAFWAGMVCPWGLSSARRRHRASTGQWWPRSAARAAENVRRACTPDRRP